MIPIRTRRFLWIVSIPLGIVGIGIALLVYFHFHDSNAISGFAEAYEAFDGVIQEFSGSIAQGDSVRSQLDTIYYHITASTQDPAPDMIRMELAKWLLAGNDSLLTELAQTDDWEKLVGEALANLGSKAALRISSLVEHDAEIMTTERNIFDLSGRELETLGAYKRTVGEKGATLKRLLQSLVDYEGGLEGLRLLGDDQQQLRKENAELERLFKELENLTSAREIAFARFQELSGL